MKKLLAFLVWAGLFLPTLALAQSTMGGLCYTTNGTNCVPAIGASASVKIDTASAATAQIIAAVTGKTLYVTSFDVFAGGTGTLKFVYGTGTNCGTGTTDLTGAYALKDQAYIVKGTGLGAIFTLPISNALCITTSATVQMSGSVSYVQF